MRKKLSTDLVVKSNFLVEAAYQLTLDEQRIILAAIVEARETQMGLGDGFVTIDAKKFGMLFGIDETNLYRQMKAALDSLYERSVVLQDTYSEFGALRVTKFRWIERQSYIDDERRLQLRFTQEMVPFITRIEDEFTAYQIKQISGLSSAHAMRIYEILRQYLPIGMRTIEVQWLKETLQITAMYPAIKDLKRWVIDSSVEQINERTDLEVSYTQGKTGRAVTHLMFKIRAKRPAKSKAQQRLAIDDDHISRHAHPGESWEQARKRLAGKA